VSFAVGVGFVDIHQRVSIGEFGYVEDHTWDSAAVGVRGQEHDQMLVLGCLLLLLPPDLPDVLLLLLVVGPGGDKPRTTTVLLPSAATAQCSHQRISSSTDITSSHCSDPATTWRHLWVIFTGETYVSS
jgi:hypothetical protein